MAFNDLPASIQAAIQLGFLEREFKTALEAKLGFRKIADREEFAGAIGESITKTRPGLLPANTTPMAPAATNDITSGLTNVQYGLEQYTLGIAQYASPMPLNVATSRVAIASVYLKNAATLAENAARSVDTLAQRALYDGYMGGNTRVVTTLGSAGTTVHVDDVRGFYQILTSQGVVVPVSSANPLLVMVGSNAYSLTGVVADGVAPSLNPWMANLAFSGTGSNSSTAPQGYSGTLTFSSNVSVADGTALNAVVSAVAPFIWRPSLASNNVMVATTPAISSANCVNNGKLTMQMVLDAKAGLASNAVPMNDETGNYIMFVDPTQMTGLYQDQAFQRFFIGKTDSKEYKKGVIAEMLGVTIVETNLNPVQTNLASTTGGAVRRAIMCGQGSLVEGVFTNEAYEAAQKVNDGTGMITMADGIAHITRSPIDVVQQVVTQAWAYAGGFVAPTDATTNPMTVPTASNANLKRAAILESL